VKSGKKEGGQKSQNSKAKAGVPAGRGKNRRGGGQKHKKRRKAAKCPCDEGNHSDFTKFTWGG